MRSLISAYADGIDAKTADHSLVTDVVGLSPTMPARQLCILMSRPSMRSTVSLLDSFLPYRLPDAAMPDADTATCHRRQMLEGQQDTPLDDFFEAAPRYAATCDLS